MRDELKHRFLNMLPLRLGKSWVKPIRPKTFVISHRKSNPTFLKSEIYNKNVLIFISYQKEGRYGLKHLHIMVFWQEEPNIMTLNHILNLIIIINLDLIIILKCINPVFPPLSEKRLMEIMSIPIPHTKPLGTRHLKPIHLLLITNLNVFIPQFLSQLNESRILIVEGSSINTI